MADEISEVYICIGHYNDVYYFIHTIYDKELFNKMEYPLDLQIINCMIHNSVIKNYNEKCVVYSIDDESIEVTLLHHTNADSFTADQYSLRHMLQTCLSTFVKKDSDEETIVFKYMYDENKILMYKINIDIDTFGAFSVCVDLPFSKIVRAETIKPI